MNKREMIERALGPYKQKADWMNTPFLLDLNSVARQAIVLEVRVHHRNPGTRITWDGLWKRFGWPISEREDIGTPGKAIAIIISLEEE